MSAYAGQYQGLLESLASTKTNISNFQSSVLRSVDELVTNVQGVANEANEVNDAHEVQVSALQATIRSKDDEITTLKQQAQDREAAKDQQIATLRQEAQAREGTLAVLRGVIARLRATRRRGLGLLATHRVNRRRHRRHAITLETHYANFEAGMSARVQAQSVTPTFFEATAHTHYHALRTQMVLVDPEEKQAVLTQFEGRLNRGWSPYMTPAMLNAIRTP